MGIIEKQSTISFVLIYIGAALGFFNRGLIMPELFTPSQIGALDVLVGYATIFSQFANLGFKNVTFRMFPVFRNAQNNHNGFLFLAVSVGIIGFLLSLIAYIPVKFWYFDASPISSGLVSDYFHLVIILVFFQIFFNLFDSYLSVLFDSVTGTLSKELIQRVFILISLVLYVLGILDFNDFVYFYIYCLSVPTIIIIAQMVRKKNIGLKPQLNFLNRDLKREMGDLALFGLLSGFSGILTLNIDRIMLERMLSLNDTGIYTTAFFYGSVLTMAIRPMIKISSAVISENWKKGYLHNIFVIYQKSIQNLVMVGCLILGIIILNLDNLYTILPEYAEGKWVVVLIGLAYLSDMYIGVNPYIIGTSKHYRWSTYFIAILAILVILFNLAFIPFYGITGAAIAVLLSRFIVNTIRFVFVYKKYKFQPLSTVQFKLTMVYLILFALCYMIPRFDNIFLDSAIRSVSYAVPFLVLSFMLQASYEFNIKVKKIIKRYIKK